VLIAFLSCCTLPSITTAQVPDLVFLGLMEGGAPAIESNFDRCFQLMKTDDLCLLQRWILAWNDLMEFEIVPVVPSKDTRATVDASAGS